MRLIKYTIIVFGFSKKSLKMIIYFLLCKINYEVANHWLTSWNVFYEYGFYSDEDNRREYHKWRTHYKHKKDKVEHL